MKDGIYYSKANGGTTWFVLNEKILRMFRGNRWRGNSIRLIQGI